MNSPGDRLSRYLLAVTFAAAGFLKIFGTGGDPTLLDRIHPSMTAVVAGVELILAALFLTPSLRRVAAWCGIFLVVVGSILVARGSWSGDTVVCGCLGPTRLGPIEHVILVACVFTLCAQLLVGYPASSTCSKEGC